MSKSVFITGATSGLGEGLALEFAKRGYRLGLVARRADRLTEVAAEIERLHPGRQVVTRTVDVTHFDTLRTVFGEVADELGGVDIAIANAGIDGGGLIGKGNFASDLDVFTTNLLSAAATIDIAVERFHAQGYGQIVAVSSMSAFRGFPGGGAYSAAKAGIATYAESARIELLDTPITVTTLYPGFIDTTFNQHIPNRPFLSTREHGVRKMADAIEKRVSATAVPRLPWSLVEVGLKIAPKRMLRRLEGY